MKKKTPNAELRKLSRAGSRTFNTEWSSDGLRLREAPTGGYGNKKRTPNSESFREQAVQPASAWDGLRRGERPTPNIEWTPVGVRLCETPAREYQNNKNQPKYDLENRLLDFAVNIVELTESLPNTRAGNHIAARLLRCATSPLSNHGEVEAAESRKDFLHKLRISLKELRETKRWLLLVGRLKRLREAVNLAVCRAEIEELIRIFAVSVRTASNNEK